VARGSYDHEKWLRAQLREQERQDRAGAAAARAAERERKQRHIAECQARAESLTHAVEERVAQLESILARGLNRSARLDVRRMWRTDPAPSLELGDYAQPAPLPDWDLFRPDEPGVFGSLFGGRSRRAARLAEAEVEFQREQREYEERERRRQAWVRDRRREHARQVEAHDAQVRRHNAEVESWHQGQVARDRDSMERYLNLVAERVPLPDELPRAAEITYSPRGEQVVARVELPGFDAVPAVARYSYVPTKDQQRETPRPKAQAAALYRSVISQITLLYVRDLFDSDPALQTVDVNGHVHTVNPATGHREYPCLISATVAREVFDGLHLRDVSPRDCLRHLNALISGHPHEVEAITPIREFDLTRYSFIEGLDAVSRLDSRPDLMDMTPTEFEHFVRQVFEAMPDIQGWTTERTGDDGIDTVIINRNSVIGGLTVVQAKKYSNVIGVSHVRELVGAMDEKRADAASWSPHPGSPPAAGPKPPTTAVSSSSTEPGCVH
jgi:restriction system protein